MGRPGQAYTLWSDSAGFVLNATLSAGGADGKSIFISSIQLVKLGASPGSSTAALRRAGTQWQLSGAGRWAAVAGRRGWWQADGEGAPACSACAGGRSVHRSLPSGRLIAAAPQVPAAVLANGTPVAPLASARAGNNITVQARWARGRGRHGSACASRSAWRSSAGGGWLASHTLTTPPTPSPHLPAGHARASGPGDRRRADHALPARDRAAALAQPAAAAGGPVRQLAGCVSHHSGAAASACGWPAG